jgi:hypothetical protein
MTSDWAVERRTVCIDCKEVLRDDKALAISHSGHLIITPYTLVPNQSKEGSEINFPFKY